MNSQLESGSATVLRTIGGLAIGLLIAGAALPAPLASQTVSIRLLDGKTGRALSDKNVTLLWSPAYFPPGSVIYFGKDGIGTVKVPTGAEFFTMHGGPKIGKEPYRIPFINCNASMSEMIRVSEVLKSGYVPGNTCSKKNAVPRPGEIVFWAMPIPWWQPDMQ
jgi:hypothetical protein